MPETRSTFHQQLDEVQPMVTGWLPEHAGAARFAPRQVGDQGSDSSS
jgi:hypothetical protein